MKAKRCFGIILFLIFSACVAGQGYTPCDELNSLLKSSKPRYNEELPQWGEFLYSYPANYNDEASVYREYFLLNQGEKVPFKAGHKKSKNNE